MFEDCQGIRVLRPDWPAPAGIDTLVTTRVGGLSDPSHDRSGMARLLPGIPVQWLRQEHGVTLVRACCADERPVADAALVERPACAAAVLTADCLPVLFCDVRGRIAAVAHAGWRGLLGGVLENTVQGLGVPPHSIMAWMGPAIGPCHFEVGEEVRQAFLQRSPGDGGCAEAFRPADRPGKWMADLYALARLRLSAAGVENVHGGSHCTVCDPEHFFSYRRDGAGTGRMASVIRIRENGACA